VRCSVRLFWQTIVRHFGVPVEAFGIPVVSILEELFVCVFVVNAVHSVGAMYVPRPKLREYLRQH
jgi:hypothetical protein